jgi:3-hydroxyisobutyrate dehydrogenase
MRVTVLGTGIMGAGVAGSLLRGGHQVAVWNRDTAKTERLRPAGATVADSPAAAVAGADAVLTVLFDADAVLSVMTAALPRWNPSAVWAQLATIGIDGTARVAALAEQHGLSLVDAPMLGTKAPAESGKLVMLISGEPALIERLSPVWEAIGSRTVLAGERVGDASALKLAANAWVQSVTVLIAQSMAMTRAFGLDPQLFLDAIRGGGTDMPYAHAKGAAMLSSNYEPSFSIDGALKDLGLIREAAQRAGLPDEILTAVQDKFDEAGRAGHGADDMAAVFTAFARNPE